MKRTHSLIAAVRAVAGLGDVRALPYGVALLESPVPTPGQVFAIGLNSAAHAAESGLAVPPVPATFTKVPSSLCGPFDDIEVHGETVDWEVELVAVIGRLADRVSEAEGWAHIAELTVGQDISDRRWSLRRRRSRPARSCLASGEPPDR